MVPADRWMDHGGLKKQLSASRCAESEVSSSNVVKCERATIVHPSYHHDVVCCYPSERQCFARWPAFEMPQDRAGWNWRHGF